MLCRHLSAHKLSATEEQPSQRERGTEHCVKERGREEENVVDRVRERKGRARDQRWEEKEQRREVDEETEVGRRKPMNMCMDGSGEEECRKGLGKINK